MATSVPVAAWCHKCAGPTEVMHRTHPTIVYCGACGSRPYGGVYQIAAICLNRECRAEAVLALCDGDTHEPLESYQDTGIVIAELRELMDEIAAETPPEPEGA